MVPIWCWKAGKSWSRGIALPAHSKIHNAFHCSLLRAFEGPPPTVIDELPLYSIDHHPVITPLAILNFQDREENGVTTRFALVQWHGLAVEDTSWENWAELFATYNLEDKVDLEAGGFVMSKWAVNNDADATNNDAGASPIANTSPITSDASTRPKQTIVKPKKLNDYTS